MPGAEPAPPATATAPIAEAPAPGPRAPQPPSDGSEAAFRALAEAQRGAFAAEVRARPARGAATWALGKLRHPVRYHYPLLTAGTVARILAETLPSVTLVLAWRLHGGSPSALTLLVDNPGVRPPQLQRIAHGLLSGRGNPFRAADIATLVALCQGGRLPDPAAVDAGIVDWIVASARPTIEHPLAAAFLAADEPRLTLPRALVRRMLADPDRLAGLAPFLTHPAIGLEEWRAAAAAPAGLLFRSTLAGHAPALEHPDLVAALAAPREPAVLVRLLNHVPRAAVAPLLEVLVTAGESGWVQDLLQGQPFAARTDLQPGDLAACFRSPDFRVRYGAGALLRRVTGEVRSA